MAKRADDDGLVGLEYGDGSWKMMVRMYAIRAESSRIIHILDNCCPIWRVGSSVDKRNSHVVRVVLCGSRALRVAMKSVHAAAGHSVHDNSQRHSP